MTISCEFNSDNCKTCSNFTMCSLLNTEKHLSNLESKVINIFSSLNQLIEFSSNTGNKLLEIEEIIPNKNDILEQFTIVYKNFDELKILVINQNEEVKKLILDYLSEMKTLSNRIFTLEKLVEKEQGKQNNNETEN